MCFYGILNSDGTLPEPLTAKQDIPVWKIFNVFNGKYLSYIFHTEYPLNKTITVEDFEIIITPEKNCFNIYKELHAFTFEEAFIEHSAISSEITKVCKCIIPKGTKYYYFNGEYVSLAIKRVED